MGLASTVRVQREAQDAINAVTQAVNAQSKAETDNARNKQFAIDQSVKLGNQLQKIEADYQNLKERNGELISPVDLTKLDAAIQDLKALKAVYDEIKGSNPNNLNAQAVSKLEENEKKATGAATQLHLALEAVNKQARIENKPAAMSNVEQNAKAAKAEVGRLDTQIKQMNETANTAMRVGVDATTIANLRAAVAELENYRKQLAAIRDNGALALTTSVTSNPAYQQALNKAQDEKKAVNDAITQAKAQNASATAKLTEEEQRLANAINQANGAGRVQSQVLSDLQGLAMQYFSVYAVQQFVSELANVTGELELQKKSLEVILNSTSMAQQLYGQIQSLSQESPYTFQDLLKSTRQLAAFGVETKDLYGTMKAISDIGAGLSVDVNRLILAFGHTRSYGYLSGIQNRQFENAGIDLMGELMKKYNAQADQDAAAGRSATYVSRKDLFKRMRNKDIPFEDVRDVVLALDKEGGKFYNMQERQFDTLGGKLRNLQNNYNIMLSEMGQSNMGMLKGGVDTINELTANWKTYYDIIWDVVKALGAAKVAQMVFGSTAMQTFSAAQLQTTKNNITKSILRGNTGWNVGQAYNMQGAAYGNAVMKSGMSDIQKAQSVMFSRVDSATRNSVLTQLGANPKLIDKLDRISKKELFKISPNTPKIMETMNKAAVNMSFAIERAKLSMSLFAANAKMAMMSLVSNPMTWIFAVVGAISAIKSQIDEANEMRDKMIDDTRQAGTEDFAHINDIFKSNPYVTRTAYNKNNYFGNYFGDGGKEHGVANIKYTLKFDDNAIRQHGPKEVLEEITKELQQYSPLYQGQIIDIMALDDDIERVHKAFEYLNKMQNVNNVFANDTTMDEAISETHNLGITDSLIEDIGDFKGHVSELDSAIADLTRTEEEYYRRTSSTFRDSVNKQMQATGESRDAAIRSLIMSGEKGAPLKSTKMNIDIKDIKGDAENIADAFHQVFWGKFDRDSDSGAMYLQSCLNKVFAEKKIFNPLDQLNITNWIVDAIGNNGDNAFANYFRKMQVGKHFNDAISGQINDKMSKEQIEDVFQQISKQTIEWGKAQGFDMKKIGMDSVENYREGLKSAMNSLDTLDADWQRRADKMFQHSTTIKNEIKVTTNMDAFAQSVHKHIKEAKEYIKRETSHIKAVESKIKVNFGLEVGTDLASLKKFEKTITSMQFVGTHNAKQVKAVQDLWKNELRPYMDALEVISEGTKWQKSEGYDVGDSNKTKSNSGNKGNQEDKLAKRFREKTKLIQDAYQWYKKWEDQIGNEGALQKVNERFGDMLKKSGIDFKDIPNYKETLMKVLDEANKAYETKGHKNSYMLEAIKTLKDAIENVNFDTFKDASDKALSSVQRELEDLTRQWDIFNSVRDTTGNESVALQLSGLRQEDTYGSPYLTKNNFLKNEVQKIMSQSGLTTGLQWDKLFAMDEDSLTKYIQGITKGTSIAQDNIKALVKTIQEWQKAEQDLMKEDITTYAKALGSMMDVPSQQARIDQEKSNQLDSIKRLEDLYVSTNGEKGITKEQADKARGIINAQALEKSEKLSAEYLTVFAHAVSATAEKISKSADVLRDNLEQKLKAGSVTPEQYAEEAAKIDKAERESLSKSFFGSKSNLSTFIKGGLPALQEKADDALAEARTRYAEGKGSIQEVADRKEEADKYANITRNLTDFGTVLSLVTGTLDGFQKAAQSLSEMFDSFGNETMANVMSDISDDISAVSGIFSPVSDVVQNALSGNVSGVISSAISAPVSMITNPITAFNKLHDKKIERHIEDIKKDLSKLEATTEEINRNRERTLGYDLGIDGSDLTTGYTEEYNTYVKELEDYRQMLEEEKSKKKSDDNAITEYESQISEMEDKIKYYKEDLMNTLYGIDLSSYADQITDALVTAWENGEDAAEAYGDTVREILQNVAKQAINNAVIAPALTKLEEKLTSDYDINDPEGSAEKIEKDLAEAMGETGYVTKAVQAGKTAWDAYNESVEETGETLYNLEEIAESLFSINVDDWASQLGDSLTNAFYNGELAAESYGDTVKSIMQSIVKQMLTTQYLEPMMEQLQNQLYGYTDSSGIVHQGAFDASNPSGSIADVVSVIKDYFGDGGAGAATITAASELENAIEQALNESGLSLLNTSSTSTTNAISSAATEETMSTVSGYLAAIRQDVSVQRVYVTQLVQDYMPDLKDKWTSSNSSLSSIDRNVENIYRAINDGDGALYNAIARMDKNINDIVVGNSSAKMR